ncbi:MAG: hypothetical protein E6Q95_00070 [Chitinophagaceae bacterium]|nr:MAG: hypothetical protein E6Q95_00070 [Chitinophagaceae bacterium]
MHRFIKFIFSSICIFISIAICAQPSAETTYNSNNSFIDYQKSFKRPMESIMKKEKMLKTIFEMKGLAWPAKYMYIRSFKYDSQLEVWVKNEAHEEYKLFKVYKVCALAGAMGPKRFEGDYQVPEGFYYINVFNPNSAYYLSLGLNYPNASDKILSDPVKPGGDIYIHGSCATVGCIPIMDDQISELYVLCAYAKSAGLDFIPVHIFPAHFNVQRSYEYLNKIIDADSTQTMRKFNEQLEQAYDYFEKYKQIPIIFTKDNGDYVVKDALPLVKKFVPVPKPKPEKNNSIVRKISDIPSFVNKQPQYEGGMEAFNEFIEEAARQTSVFMPENAERINVSVEFIVDKDGTPVNFKIIQGFDEIFDAAIINRLAKMKIWKPATLSNKPVPRKIIQYIEVRK